ncbi:MAG: PadR family transcriptional regulator [Spirochaetes bacterium]|nr:PadR family transcriptional regulator [Spirochaetota bacterium]
MKVPVYILGFLKRYGPLHGYRLKRLVADMVSDFTQIKLPTIYYHLEKMEEKGLVTAERKQEGRRPERSVYSITKKGEREFLALLRDTLAVRYRPEFQIDAPLFFFDSMDPADIVASLREQEKHCSDVLDHLEAHREEVMQHIPPEARRIAGLMFQHHSLHYRAELEWLQDSLRELDR